MAGGQYLCPVCHQPFEVIGAKKAHVGLAAAILPKPTVARIPHANLWSKPR
jgi:hypothetical protein